MKHRKYKKKLHPARVVTGVSYSACSSLISDSFYAKFQLAFTLHRQGDLVQAASLYNEILHAHPFHFDSLQYLAAIAVQQKRYDDAVTLFKKAFAVNPDNPRALNNCGIALKELKRYEEALLCYNKAIELRPDYAEAYSNLGNALQMLARYEEALLSYDLALQFKPDYTEAYYNLGLALFELGQFDLALEYYDKALAINPVYLEVYSSRGIALAALKRNEEALLTYDRVLALKPDYAEVYSNRGIVLADLKRYEDALANYDRAISIKPDYAEVYSNRGILLAAMKRYDDALDAYDKAITLQPDYADAYSNRALLLVELRRFQEASYCYDKAILINPNGDYLFGEGVRTRMQICDWETFDSDIKLLLGKLSTYSKAITPFPLLALVDSMLLHKRAAMTFVDDTYPLMNTLPEIAKIFREDKLCIGYYSADFHDHATAYLMAELFEHHDRSRFELIAFSFGPDQHNDSMRKRVVSAFDRFIDVRNYSDEEVALLSRELGVAIAVDLKGFTTNCRTGIFALRAAPIQVNYLGYPGTMGASYIDYLIADHILIPEESRQFYTEKIAYLPNSYQVNDRTRQISDRVFTREEFGLPKTGFVFCCFNNNYKITPSTFDGWMRLLKQVEGSVLWLLADNAKAAEHLMQEAVRRGVLSERLIFAKRMNIAEHLARHRLADLFLDTLPCNAHTTASDALWAGLPVLTCIGESFASRVAASLLNAIQLPELITSTQAEYEALALELATNPKKLHTIKHKLEKNRLTTPLFDTGLFTGDIEKVYMAMYERYLADLPPEHILLKLFLRAPLFERQSISVLPKVKVEDSQKNLLISWMGCRRVTLVRFRIDKEIYYRAFDEVVEGLIAGLKEIGVHVNVAINEVNLLQNNILIGAHLLSDEALEALPSNVIIYNLEQLVKFTSSSICNRPAYINALRVHHRWDYSLNNIATPLDYVLQGNVEYVPVGYASCLSRVESVEQDIDVLFYGGVTFRRKKICDALKDKGYNVCVSCGVYGVERDSLIRRAKLVLNVHLYDSHILEVVRVSYLMANSKAVVCECASDTEVYPHFRDGLCLVAYDDIVNACVELLVDDVKRHDLEKRAFCAVKKLTYAEVLRKTALFASAGD